MPSATNGDCPGASAKLGRQGPGAGERDRKPPRGGGPHARRSHLGRGRKSKGPRLGGPRVSSTNGGGDPGRGDQEGRGVGLPCPEKARLRSAREKGTSALSTPGSDLKPEIPAPAGKAAPENHLKWAVGDQRSPVWPLAQPTWRGHCRWLPARCAVQGPPPPWPGAASGTGTQTLPGQRLHGPYCAVGSTAQPGAGLVHRGRGSRGEHRRGVTGAKGHAPPGHGAISPGDITEESWPSWPEARPLEDQRDHWAHGQRSTAGCLPVKPLSSLKPA